MKTNNLLDRIHDYVVKLELEFNEKPTISMPKYFKGIIEDNMKGELYDQNKERDGEMFLFGCKVINGFGNKIVVFNENASPEKQNLYFEID